MAQIVEDLPVDRILLPRPVRDAYAKGELAVLVGSGLSIDCGLPRWRDLPHGLLDYVKRESIWRDSDAAHYAGVFQKSRMPLEGMLSHLDPIKTALGMKYQAALNPLFRPPGATPTDAHRAVVELGVRVLATTNYDLLLEAAEGAPSRTSYTWLESDKALVDIQDGRRVLFKIHGTAERADTVIMTKGEYEHAQNHEAYKRSLSYLLQSHVFLLVGYGMNDPLDLDLVFEMNFKHYKSAARTHYALMKDAAATDCERWRRDCNIQVVDLRDYSEIPATLRGLRAHPHDVLHNDGTGNSSATKLDVPRKRIDGTVPESAEAPAGTETSPRSMRIAKAIDAAGLSWSLSFIGEDQGGKLGHQRREQRNRD